MIYLGAKYRSIFARALALWGFDSQVQMAYGECGEFITLAGRKQQGRGSDSEYIDEIADNLIMMTQMRNLFGPDKVDARIKYKMDRLEKKITMYEDLNKLGEV